MSLCFLSNLLAMGQSQSGSRDTINDAVVRGDVKTVKTMISANRSLINTKDVEDWVPIHFAVIAEKNEYELVEFLLKSGADVNASSKYGDTPLSLAARRHVLNVAQLLLRNNAKVNSLDDSGLTSLHNAVSKCDQEMAALLLSNSANPNLKSTDAGGATPLHLAVECKRAMVELLLAKGADANAINSTRHTALDMAIDLAYYYKDTNKDDAELQRVIELLRRYTKSRDARQLQAYSLVQ